MMTIRPTGCPAAIRARQQGVAAVEFALILTMVVMLMSVPIYFGKVFSHYSVAQKAARDAAIYFTTVPLASISTQDGAAAAVAAAKEIVAAEVSDLRPGIGQVVKVDILCDNGECGLGKPVKISVHVNMSMRDDDGWTAPLGVFSGVDLSAVVEMKYLGK